MRIAIATDDLVRISKEHFGDAKYYMIFDVDLPCINFVEVRKNKAAEMEEEDEHGHGDPKKFEAVISQLKDVDTIVAYAVGPNVARVKLKAKKGVIIIREVERIGDAIKLLPEKLGYMVRRFKGEVFKEILEINGKKYEHAGFRDDKGEFGNALFEALGQKDKKEAMVAIAIKK